MSPQNIKYGMQRSLSLPFEAVVERTRTALQKAGFGVLFESDSQLALSSELANR